MANSAAPCGSPPRAWGKQRSSQYKLLVYKVHPHVRGENCGETIWRDDAYGSPPRAWGKLKQELAASVVSLGSPPREWGKRACVMKALPIPRFTPTCVGKTSSHPSNNSLSSVHPHVRGENAEMNNENGRLLRFTPTCVGKTNSFLTCTRSCHRFTPTCVGKTYATTATAKTARRFTPTCVGKTHIGHVWVSVFAGSSPRAWGKTCASTCAHTPK